MINSTLNQWYQSLPAEQQSGRWMYIVNSAQDPTPCALPASSNAASTSNRAVATAERHAAIDSSIDAVNPKSEAACSSDNSQDFFVNGRDDAEQEAHAGG